MNDSASDRVAILYPEITPFRTGFLKVSNIHRLYFEVSGNPAGKPVVVFHGGPGFGSTPNMRRYFDPSRYKIVLFDQRGCGRSKPHACLIENTTKHLVADIEQLRRHLSIERWQVFGGSWGSTLAIAYAEAFPHRVSELVLRGIFLLRRSEINWFYQSPEGAAALFPDLWETYVEPIPPSERGKMVEAYYRRLTSADRRVMLRAARAWSTWEAATSYLRPNAEFIATMKVGSRATAFARIECHYFMNRGFFRRDGQLLTDIEAIRNIPGVIIQGRYDVVCPMRSAWDLHRAWPEAELRIVDDAGHSSTEPGITRELIRATDGFASS